MSSLAILSSAPWVTSTGMVSFDMTAVAASGLPTGQPDAHTRVAPSC